MNELRKLELAIERAKEMLRIAGPHAENFGSGETVFYDGTDCDGGCINMDCEDAAFSLTTAFADFRATLKA